MFNLKANLQKLVRMEYCGRLQNLIQKPALREKIDWLSQVDRRLPFYLDARVLEPRERLLEVASPISDVGSESQKNGPICSIFTTHEPIEKQVGELR